MKWSTFQLAKGFGDLKLVQVGSRINSAAISMCWSSSEQPCPPSKASMLQVFGGVQQRPPGQHPWVQLVPQAKPAQNSASNTAPLQTRPSLVQGKRSLC